MIVYIILILLSCGIIYLIYTSKWKEIYDFFFVKERKTMKISSRSPSPVRQKIKYARPPQPHLNTNISFRNSIASSSIVSKNKSNKKKIDSSPIFLTNADQNSSPIIYNRSYSCSNQNSYKNLNNKKSSQFSSDSLKSSNRSEIPSGFHYYAAAYEDPVGLQSGYKFIQEKLKAKNDNLNKVPEKTIENVNDEKEDSSKEHHHHRRKTRSHRHTDNDENENGSSSKRRHRRSSSNRSDEGSDRSNNNHGFNRNNRSSNRNSNYNNNRNTNNNRKYNKNFHAKREPNTERGEE